MFDTPDFGHSDIWHFNFALKFLLSQALKAGYLPFWSKDIGSGFPLLGEGQIGMFNWYNFLAFKFLGPVVAFNLGYLVIFLTLFLGSYLFGRIIKLSRLSAIFLAVIFTFSGVFVTQINHFNLLQAASFLPWAFFLTEKFLQTRKRRWLIFLTLGLWQQILSGFQQMFLIPLIGVGIYLLVRLRQQKTLTPLFPWLLSVAFALILAWPQIHASQQLIASSSRNTGLSIQDIAAFPLPPKALVGFFLPYIWGDPRIGTYPPFSPNWGIFWESTGYFGLIPVLLSLSGIFLLRQKKDLKPYLIIAGLSLVLLLGKFTPFFFVFQIPPLSYFRVPARFLLLFVWCLTIFAATIFNKIPGRTIPLIILLLSALDIGRFALTYNPVINSQNWLKPPKVVEILRQDPSWFRIYTVPITKWNLIFLKDGWKNIGQYQDFRNALDPNQNLYWSIPSANVYAGLSPKRQDLWQAMASEGITVNLDTNSGSISTASAKILSFSSVKYLISSVPLNPSQEFEFSATVSGTPEFYLYRNASPRPHAYLTRNYVVAQNLTDLVSKMATATESAVVLESPVNLTTEAAPPIPVSVTRNEDTAVEILAEAENVSLLVLTDSFYPGWTATIDNWPTTILPVNLNQRAVIFPRGHHIVKFTYQPLKIF